ncbi:MAG: glycosyltransferase [Deltaproteobacteria bacterium]|nr:glycosyltransferase [Deltaproteobacteria bacterium]
MTELPMISILMPAYNEGHVIYESIQRVVSFMNTSSYRYEIIISDDGSWDNTFSEAMRAKQEFGIVTTLRGQKNKGKGHALKHAFLASRGDIIVFLDADLDMPPAQLSLFFHSLEKDSPDIIIASKRHPNSIIQYPLERKILSLGYSFLMKLLFGLPVRDTQTGLKVFQRPVLEKIFPRVLCKKFAYDVEILALAHYFGYRIHELPVIITYDRYKWSRVGLETVFQIAKDTAAIFYRLKILKWYQREEGVQSTSSILGDSTVIASNNTVIASKGTIIPSGSAIIPKEKAVIPSGSEESPLSSFPHPRTQGHV